jgi:geranylgeranyl diphosphate synthase type II
LSRSPAGTVSASGRERARTRPSAADPLAARRGYFNRYFEQALVARGGASESLRAAMLYAALSPGKRLRPLLVLEGCEAVGGGWRRALPAAAAVEAVHAFSLVHDDLPAMDDDDYRRGLPTTHKKYGEAMAILAGDALLAFAFRELSELLRRGVSPLRVVDAVSRLAVASGAEQLIAGQALDLEAEGRPVREHDLCAIHVRKTGALFGAALALGGIAGNGRREQVDALEQAGRHLGLAFQIRDDVLNAGSSLARLGKRAGTDAERGKATYPALLGAALAEQRGASHLDLARAILEDYRLMSRSLERLIAGLPDRER